MDQPNCFKCRHLIITYQAQRNYACRAMGFKSRFLPSRVVFRESGMPCLLFAPKPSVANKAKK